MKFSRFVVHDCATNGINQQSKIVKSSMLGKDAARLAHRIRAERIARSWSLDEMAKRSGVSRAMIHRVEGGISSPTAALLGKISGALRISMSALFREASVEPDKRLVRAEDRNPWRDSETGYVREPINSEINKEDRNSHTPQITRVTLPPGARVPLPRSAFEFIAQAVWVLEGTLHFIEGDMIYELDADDCPTLGAPQECVFVNRSGKPCTYVVVVT